MKNTTVFDILIIILVIVIIIFTTACVEENCYQTDEVIGYKTIEKKYYTITEPIYAMRCE